MEEKLDLRVQRTYKSLVEAFTALLSERRYEEITISDLCSRAMIRRTTFYKHFADKQEFFVFYIWRLRDGFEAGLPQAGQLDAARYALAMCGQLTRFFLEHERLVDSALASNLLGIIVEAISAQIARDLEPLLEAGDGADAKLQAAFLAGGIVQTVRAWWPNRQADPDAAQMMQALSTMIH